VHPLATVSTPASDATAKTRGQRTRFLVHEMGATLAVGVIWLVVLVVALFGPDIVTSNASGYARIPSAVVIAFFAFFATWVVARHGFAHPGKDVD
jgi:ABC-type nickel/cobalt efflux system permease component RcnA